MLPRHVLNSIGCQPLAGRLVTRQRWCRPKLENVHRVRCAVHGLGERACTSRSPRALRLPHGPTESMQAEDASDSRAEERGKDSEQP